MGATLRARLELARPSPPIASPDRSLLSDCEHHIAHAIQTLLLWREENGSAAKAVVDRHELQHEIDRLTGLLARIRTCDRQPLTPRGQDEGRPM